MLEKYVLFNCYFVFYFCFVSVKGICNNNFFDIVFGSKGSVS